MRGRETLRCRVGPAELIARQCCFLTTWRTFFLIRTDPISKNRDVCGAPLGTVSLLLMVDHSARIGASAPRHSHGETSMETAGDDPPGGEAITALEDPESSEALGRRLQGFRAYLLKVAGREMNADLRAKCGASDLVQQAFCEAVRDRAALRGRTPQQVRGWLRGILIHTLRDVARSYGLAKRKVALELPIDRGGSRVLVDPEMTPSTRALASEEARAVDAALTRLPEDYRRVIELRNREGRPFGEIGAALGRSADAARMLWFRAIERLQRELTETDAA
jgi:RNA polymerase sigma-70 factor, ECF subfamily